MRFFPFDEETEIIVRFDSRKQHEAFCQATGAGSRFIYREKDDGKVHVLCRLDRRITKYGESVLNPAWLTDSGKPRKSTKVTPLELSLLNMR
jgi:hypothetical protein